MEELIQMQLKQAIELSDHQQFKALNGHTTADLNFNINKEGVTPLMLAAAQGDSEMMHLLL
jgi:ankyrin repeat protein